MAIRAGLGLAGVAALIWLGGCGTSESGAAKSADVSNGPATSEPVRRVPESAADIASKADADAWAVQLAADHQAPYPGKSAAAWVSADVALGWMEDYTFRLLQGPQGVEPSSETLAIAFTATDPRAVFSFEKDGAQVSYDQDTLLYLHEPSTGAAWIAGAWQDEVDPVLSAGRRLE
jgi:hypothetical protein